MSQSTVFKTLPRSTMNPLLSLTEFGKFCAKRFRGFPMFNELDRWVAEWEEAGILRPAYVDPASSTRLYSIFQIWQVARMWHRSPSDAEDLIRTFRDYEKVLRVLVEVQDYYLPLVRSDRRVGEDRNYSSVVRAGGLMMSETSYVLLSSVERARRWAISTGRINPGTILVQAELSVEQVREWADRIIAETRFWDPLKDWRLFLSFCSYPMKQKLRWKALLANDYYEIGSILWAFLEDHVPAPVPEPFWRGDSLPPVGSAARSEWLQEWYGDALDKPFEMIEFLSNQYGVNPRPRGIIFTEGEEWRALEALYRFYDYPPLLLGIEFRSIRGEGNFKLANWQCFIEYMHEKQVLVYFVLDHEGETARQARRLLDRKRSFRFPFLEKVIPTEDRIRIWPTSFEEENFTDAAIARCLKQRGHEVEVAEVAGVRNEENRRKALISAIVAEKELDINKPQLVEDLAADLIALRRRRPQVRRLRPVEEFVKSSGELIMLNHQPTIQESKVRNLQSGLVG